MPHLYNHFKALSQQQRELSCHRDKYNAVHKVELPTGYMPTTTTTATIATTKHIRTCINHLMIRFMQEDHYHHSVDI